MTEQQQPHPTPAVVGALGVLAFLLELVMFALLAVAGWRLGGSTVTSLALAVVLVAVVAVMWGRWMAPMSAHRLPSGPRAALATGLFVATGALGLLAGISDWICVLVAVAGSALFVGARKL